MLILDKYSIGTGDRFARQGKALLPAVKQAHNEDGLNLSIGLHVKTAGTTWLEELIGLAKPGNADRCLSSVGS